MRLNSIRLSGFKSFADLTVIDFPGQFCSIIGPNGCGKSNIVDAIWWVIGASSARQLRSESMSEVIFKGSDSRKPMSRCAAELHFDNSEGKLGGQYATYSELQIRREMDSEGISTYYLNGHRCRRRDIVDIFLGTGLGSRSYAVVGQGMVSRIVEYRPDEMRRLVEEAAGISRYRERRQETETKIARTRVNLSRIDDLLTEMQQRLRHLKKQVTAADAHQRYSKRRALLQAQLALADWHQCQADLDSLKKERVGVEQQLEKFSTALFKIDREAEQLQQSFSQGSEQLRELQQQFYGTRSDAARTEETVSTKKQREVELAGNCDRLVAREQELSTQLQRDTVLLAELREQGEALQSGLIKLRQQSEQQRSVLVEQEQSLAQLAGQWEQSREQLRSVRGEVERFQIEEQALLTEKQNTGLRIEELQTEIDQAGDFTTGNNGQHSDVKLEVQARNAAQRRQQLQTEQNDLEATIAALQAEYEKGDTAVNTIAAEQARLRGRYQALLSPDDSDQQQQWLDQHQLSDLKILEQSIQIEEGWELAVRQVLGERLQSLCSADLERLLTTITELPPSSVTVISAKQGNGRSAADSLAARVTAPAAVIELLSGVMTVADRRQLIDGWQNLQDHQTLISADGLWAGSGWLQIAGSHSEYRQLGELKTALHSCEQQYAQAKDSHKRVNFDLQTAQGHLVNLRHQLLAAVDEDSRLQTSTARQKAESERLNRLVSQLRTATDHSTALDEKITGLKQQQNAAKTHLDELVLSDRQTSPQRDRMQLKVAEQREQLSRFQHDVHGLELQNNSLQSQQEELQRGIDRQGNELQHNADNLSELREHRKKNMAPVADLERQLREKLAQQEILSAEMTEAQQQLRSIEQAQQQLLRERKELDTGMNSLRAEQTRINGAVKDIELQNTTTEQEVSGLGLDLQTVLDELPDAGIDPHQWQTRLRRLQSRIDNLGPVNPAAEVDYRQAEQRQDELSRQHKEITATLEILENAIATINRQTRQSFQQTIDKINEQLKTYIAKLFGSGSADLQLLEGDLLSAGVQLRARPAGKRTTDIRQLSGGEKSLVALALIFSIFQLNPAPFCVMDEIDAPLDDRNTRRFVDLVQEIGHSVQMICVTHNKITMEFSEQLLGVTMPESGVSKVVGVDLAAAQNFVRSGQKKPEHSSTGAV